MFKSAQVYTATLLGATLTLGLTLAQAAQSSEADVLRGSVTVLEDGKWVASERVPTGKWFRSDSSETTVALSGSTVRLQKGTAVLLNRNEGNRVDLKARDGSLFVKVRPESQCDIHTPAADLVAANGEFQVDAKNVDNLQVLQGTVSAAAKPPARMSLKELDKALALDGPDVRKRGRNRKRFTQGEENKGRRIGEDALPTQSATPPMTETPAYTPSPSPSFTPPSPSPTAPQNPPQNPPPSATGGSPWPWLAPTLAAVGTGTYFLVRDTNDEPDRAVFPNSP